MSIYENVELITQRINETYFRKCIKSDSSIKFYNYDDLMDIAKNEKKYLSEDKKPLNITCNEFIDIIYKNKFNMTQKEYKQKHDKLII
jgi:hypothetical protein